MKIAITGGAGFIGAHLADAFIKQGHEVLLIDNLSTGMLRNINPKASFVELDICSNQIEGILSDYKIELISHQAAQVNVRKSVAEPCLDANTNIIGTINLLEAARKTNVKHFIFASTGGAIYGEQEYFPADENHPLNPCSPYGIAKLAAEKYIYYYQITYGLQTTILRYANVYGPRQNPHGEAGVIAIFCDQLRNQKPLTINGDGLQTRDYIYIDDVVQANLLLLNSTRSNTYNVGTGIETTVNEIANHLNSLAKTNNIICKPEQLGEQRRSCINSDKLKKDFGWQIVTNLMTGLKYTFASF